MAQLARDKIQFPGLLRDEGKNREKGMIVIREASRARKKAEIRTLFRGNGTLYYSDIVEKSGISLRTVVEICDELKADGEIALDKEI